MITSLASIQSCLKIKVPYRKAVKSTNLSGFWQSLFALGTANDIPSNSTWSAGNTSNGIVPDGTSAAGYPAITSAAFGLGLTGYLTKVDFVSPFSLINFTQAQRWVLYDRVFVAGAYNFNDSVTLSSQPSYSGRLPFKSDGTTTDYAGLELWVETASTFTGTQAFAVTYTDQSGNAGHTTGTISAPVSNFTVGGCWQLPLASGDCGIQKIESVVGSGGSAGTANIMVLRPLGWGYANTSTPCLADSKDFVSLGMPKVFYNSALYVLSLSTSSQAEEIAATFEISVG